MSDTPLAQSADYERGEPKVEGARIGPMMGSEETYRRALIAAYGRCTCPSDCCDAEGEPGCGFCQHLDPEWPCPHDPENGWPKDVVAG